MVLGQPRPVLTALPAGSSPAGKRRAAVVGSPVAHSLSPVLHRAAYAALGLDGWTYDRSDVPRGALADHVAGLGPEWAGLSVTMPGKEEALALADASSAVARLAGAANTLVRLDDDRWYADNTDVHGLASALAGAGVEAPRRAVVLGGGATARSAVLALRQLAAAEVTVLVRDRLRPGTAELLRRVEELGGGPVVRTGRLADGIRLGPKGAEVVVGTLPAGAAPPSVSWDGTKGCVVLDAVYEPWPSTLALAVARATGGRVAVVRGTEMLLHQAVRQVELMTGRTPPLEVMAAALAEHVEGEGR